MQLNTPDVESAGGEGTQPVDSGGTGPGAGALRAALAGATAALLAPGLAMGQSVQPARTPWQVDSAVLIYKEGGGRVTAVEPVVSLRRTDGNDRTVGLKLTLDSLTGASPNGAVPQPGPQTFTSPSGKSTYSTPAGVVPLDDSFHDRRVALAATLEQPVGQDRRLALGVSLSNEYDFTSLSANAALAQDFNQKNTTVSLGVALEADRIKAVGGAPEGLQSLTGGTIARLGPQSRNVADLLLGVTQVMNRRWVMQANLGLGRGSGDHTDAYKRLSVVDGGTGLLTGDQYVSELRPDSRSRVSLYWQNKVHLDRDVVDLSYRYYRDDWGVRAHTLDLRYRWQLAGGMYVEPQLRWYRQSAADFWRGWLVEGTDWSSATHTASLAQASADPRLGAFTAQTLGAKFGVPLGPGRELTVRVQSYRQKPKALSGAPGVLDTLDLVPTLKATTVMLGYSFEF